ncbi:SAM-dependent methyltransferase [Saccharopolyspora sp. NPDC049426]|uniref:SAM-dependent methyltransferase n=1 Tax=Saccharopolyspora sp. NPDC049426 TaxID=3155652 RepID=UPI00342A6340
MPEHRFGEHLDASADASGSRDAIGLSKHEVNISLPNPARIYDYGLGGDHNFASDREAFHKLLEVDPDARTVVRSNRAFLRRAVRFCLERGITQFLDLGSGVPTVGNVHDAAHEMNPDARVVYVDNEPIAAAHTRRLLQDQPNTAIIEEDLRDPEAVLNAPETAGLLDFSQPVALMMAAVLHWVGDDVTDLLARYRRGLVPGSALAISHLTDEDLPEQMREVEAIFDETSVPVTYRPRAQASELFTGFDIVEPGAVYCSEWRSEPHETLAEPERTKIWAAVGIKT